MGILQGNCMGGGRSWAAGCSNEISKIEMPGCDDIPMRQPKHKPPELTFSETVYNITQKKPELVGEIVVEKISHLSKMHPEYDYQSVKYQKDSTGGMTCFFKFKRK